MRSVPALVLCALVTAAVGLAGCGGADTPLGGEQNGNAAQQQGGGGGGAQLVFEGVRVHHFATGATGPLNLALERGGDQLVFGNALPYGGGTRIAPAAGGGAQVVARSADGSELLSTAVEVPAGPMTWAVYGDIGSGLQLAAVPEDGTAPAEGHARVVLLHAMAGEGAVTLSLADRAAPLGTASQPGAHTAAVELPREQYDREQLIITDAGGQEIYRSPAVDVIQPGNSYILALVRKGSGIAAGADAPADLLTLARQNW